MEVRSSPRRRVPSRRLLSASRPDRVEESRVSKRSTTPRTASHAIDVEGGHTRIVTPRSTSYTKDRRSRTVPLRPSISEGDTRTTRAHAGRDDSSMVSSAPAQAKERLFVKRARPSPSLDRRARQRLRPSDDQLASVDGQDMPLHGAETLLMLSRGAVVSPTNAQMVLVRGEMRPNPFFETMPAPAMIRRHAPLHFLVGETTDMQEHIGSQVARELAEGMSSPSDDESKADMAVEETTQDASKKQPPSFFSRLYDQASTSLGFGKARRVDSCTHVKLPHLWDLPQISDAETFQLVQKLPRDAATL